MPINVRFDGIKLFRDDTHLESNTTEYQGLIGALQNNVRFWYSDSLQESGQHAEAYGARQERIAADKAAYAGWKV